jgi:Autotransporter beta-domain
MTSANSELGLATAVTYVGGRVQGYTETGSSTNLTVGSQSIREFDARAGLTGSQGLGGDVRLSSKIGALVASNLGSSTTPITLLGQTLNAVSASSTAYGGYAGFDLAVPVSDAMTLSGGVDASARSDGLVTGAGNVKLSARY